MSDTAGKTILMQREGARIGDRVVNSAALLWSMAMLLRLLQLVTTTILARLLAPNDYGIVALAATVVGFIDLMSNLQIGGAIIRKSELSQDYLDSAFTLNLIRGILTGLLLFGIAGPVAVYLNEPRLSGVLRALAAPAIASCIHNPYFLLYARNLDFSKDTKRNAAAAFVGSIFGVAAALLLRSYWALVVSSVASSGIMMALSYWKVPGRPRISFSKTSELLSYGSWLVLVNLMDYANSKVDYFLVGKGLGSEKLGAYHVGQQITLMATGDVIAPLTNALLPAFSLIANDRKRLKENYQQVQTISLALALPFGIGASLLAENIIVLLVGVKWALAIPVITYLAPLIALQTMTASIESLALALNKGRLLAIRTGIFLVVRTTLMFVGFYYGGFIGIVYARVASGTFSLLYGLALAAKLTGGRTLTPIILGWRSLASGGAMIAALRLLPNSNLEQHSTYQIIYLLLIKIALGGTVYTGTHIGFWMLCGRPEGAERRIIDQVFRMLKKFTGPRN